MKIIIAFLLFFIHFLWLTGCDEGEERVTTTLDTARIIDMPQISGMISMGVRDREKGETVPTKMTELVEWLQEKYAILEGDDHVDWENKVIIDTWGRPVVLIVHDGILNYVGSRGPNGKWENGQGDDIVKEIDYYDITSIATTISYGIKARKKDETFPAEMSKLVTWLQGKLKFLERFPYVNMEDKVFIDRWNRPVVLIVKGDKLTHVGGCGPNGKWDNRQGDDVVEEIDWPDHIVPTN